MARITGGRSAERRLGLADTLAGCIRDWCDPALVVRTLSAMLRFRMFAIACGGACPRAGEAGPGEGCRRLRRPAHRSPVQAGRRPGAGEMPCPVFAAHHEPSGERALAHRGGAHDGGAGRHLLPLLLRPAHRHHPRHRRLSLLFITSALPTTARFSGTDIKLISGFCNRPRASITMFIFPVRASEHCARACGFWQRPCCRREKLIEAQRR